MQMAEGKWHISKKEQVATGLKKLNKQRVFNLDQLPAEALCSF